MNRALLRLAVLSVVAPALSGCVAAIVPLAAGGAILGKDRINPKDIEEPVQTADPAVQPQEIPQPAATTSAEPAVVDEPAPEATDPELPARNDNVEESEEESSAPVAATVSDPIAVPAQTATIGPTDFRAYDVLYNYVDLQSRRDPIENPRQSALLAAPGTLSPIRTDCSIRPPSVLIDLDPGDAAFDPSIMPGPNPALMQMLASLRAQDIDIFWTSRLAAVRAGDVRRALISSGLDARGRDGLLLMRNADDRKQTRRKELGETHCLIAISGDRRADFDELYLYLKDRSAAQSLEELIGAGWFLTPLPLSEGQSQ